MRPIPSAQRERMANDPYYKSCCLQWVDDNSCSGRIEWHHNLKFASKQSNEKWSILPLCHSHHMMADKSEIKEKLNWIMLNRASTFELTEVSRAVDYVAMRERLNKKYA